MSTFVLACGVVAVVVALLFVYMAGYQAGDRDALRDRRRDLECLAADYEDAARDARARGCGPFSRTVEDLWTSARLVRVLADPGGAGDVREAIRKVRESWTTGTYAVLAREAPTAREDAGEATS